MLIEVKDLRVGDEILIPRHSGLKYLRVLREPRLKTKSTDIYRAVYCSHNSEIITRVFSGRTYTYKVPKCTPEDHNVEKYENLNYKTIWLVKRERE